MRRVRRIASAFNMAMAAIFGVVVNSGGYAFAAAIALWVIVEKLDDILFALRELLGKGEK